MESIFESQISWSSFIKAVVWLFAVFAILKIFRRWLALDRFGKRVLDRPFREYLKMFIHKLLLIYEPVAVLIFTTALFLVDPFRHGLIILILLIVGFPSLKNYINGRLLLLGTSLSKATRIQTSTIKGAIIRWERLGLYLQTEDGLRHIPYSHLVEQGFTLISGERMGHLVDFNLIPEDSNNSSFEKLKGIIATCPYLDPTHKPNLMEMPDHVRASLILRDEMYLTDLIQVLAEWGWKCNTDT